MNRTSAARPLRFLWFGSYATGPGYPRTSTLHEGLQALSHEVREVHAPLFEDADDRVSVGSGGGALRLAWRQAKVAVRLAARWFREGEYDVAVVGPGGLMDPLTLRFLQNIHRRPVVLDQFVPLYDTVVRDRGLAPPDSFRARLLLRLERWCARVSDLVLADTGANAELIREDLHLAPGAVAVVPIAQRDPGEPAPLPETSPLEVLLAATYIPLHGMETVVDAARILGGDGVRITIVGEGQGSEEVRARARDVAGLTFVPRFLPEDAIRSRLASSHVGLGIFGDTPKAGRVVPLKAALTLSCGRALVTREGPAASEALGDAAALVPPADPEALAAALRRLRDDRRELLRLAGAGRRLYLQRYTPEKAAERLMEALGAAGLDPRSGQP